MSQKFRRAFKKISEQIKLVITTYTTSMACTKATRVPIIPAITTRCIRTYAQIMTYIIIRKQKKGECTLDILSAVNANEKELH